MSSVNATSEYELVLMLDPESTDEEREKIAADARGRIESAGELRHDETWGKRKMAYEIRRRTEADYRFFRFRGVSALLDDLNHSLKIADGVLRFRLFKVDPRAPIIVPPPPTQPSRGGRKEGRPRRSEGRGGRSRDEAAEAGDGTERGAAKPAEPAPAPAPSGPDASAAVEPDESGSGPSEAGGSKDPERPADGD